VLVAGVVREQGMRGMRAPRMTRVVLSRHTLSHATSSQDCSVYAQLLHAVTVPRAGARTFAADELRHRHFPAGLLDVEASLRAAEVVRRLHYLKCPGFLRPQDICSERADLNLAMVIFLFVRFPSMRRTAVGQTGVFDAGYGEVMVEGTLPRNVLCIMPHLTCVRVCMCVVCVVAVA